MYVRWNRRKRTKASWRRKEGDYLTAVLVESARIDGKPRQRIIKSLGSIGEERLKDKNFHSIPVYCFWLKVRKNLLLLGLSDTETEKIVSDLCKKVPMVTDEEMQELWGEEGYRNIRKVNA
jgi:hypothetical protein